MNKKIGIIAMATLVALGLTSCGKKSKNDQEIDTNKEEYNVSFLGMNYELLDKKKVSDGDLVTAVSNPSEEGYEFKGWVDRIGNTIDFTNEKITSNKTYYASFSPIEYNVKFDSVGAGVYEDIKYTTDKTVALPYPSKAGKIFSGWTDGTVHNMYSIPAGKVGNMNLTAEFSDPKELTATYKIMADDYSVGNISKEKGIFKVSGETRGRIATWTNPDDKNESKKFSKSFKNPTVEIKPNVDGKIAFYIQNGSSSAATQSVKITPSNGSSRTEVFSGATQAVGKYGSGSPIVKIEFDATEGVTYSIQRVSGTIDIYALEFQCQTNEESISSIKLFETPDANVLEGTSYDGRDIRVIANYGGENGYEYEIDSKDISIDDSAVNYSKPGTYKAKAVYCGKEAEFDINVYQAVDFTVNKYKTVVENNGYNDVYITKHLSSFIYGKTKEFDTSGLSITMHSLLNGVKKDFIIKDRIEINYNNLEVGENNLSVDYCINGKDYNTTYKVQYVLTEPYKDANDNYVVTVDKNYGSNLGIINGSDGNTFKTITQALDYFKYNNLINEKKIINVKAGLYKEKLEFDLPNLTLRGAGTCKATYSSDVNYDSNAYNNATIIEWNSLYGIPDESGFSQVTDSTATVAVRKSAVNCVFENITLSNEWNCEQVFNDKIKYLEEYGIAVSGKVNDHRALAFICQADKFQMNSCSLLGYQDTVEFMTGRQYVKNTYISGNTDFIFGTNATTYFYKCEIHFIFKNSTSVPVGYITAYKGANDELDTAIDYGFIFDECKFTADDKVVKNSVALGRPWGKYSQVTFMNSVLCDKISKAADSRYYSMSGVNPTDETVRYYEYNNTGDGAISSSLAGVGILSEEEANKYNDFTIIFGKTNGKITYEDAWNPVK